MNIRAKIESILNQYGMQVEDIKKKITFVTDRDANFVAVFTDFDRFSCQDHILNNCLQSTFFKYGTTNEYD